MRKLRLQLGLEFLARVRVTVMLRVGVWVSLREWFR